VLILKSPAHNNNAFTLIELILVVSLVGITLFFTVPRLHQSFFMPDSRKFTAWMQLNIKDLKNKAVQNGIEFVLCLDLDENRIWTAHALMDEEALEKAKSTALELSSDSRLVSVVYPNENRVSDGIAKIKFYPAGYSDRAVVNVETGQYQRVSYEIQSFLPQVRLLDEENDLF
jgi:prepilin-type N-terminal cleavage/methylation domain-containing protein